LLSNITIRRIQQEAPNLLNGNQNNEAETINTTDNTNATLNQSTNKVKQRSDNKQRENNTQTIQSTLNEFNTALAEFSSTDPTKKTYNFQTKDLNKITTNCRYTK
jgi:hypothetical protein